MSYEPPEESHYNDERFDYDDEPEEDEFNDGDELDDISTGGRGSSVQAPGVAQIL